MTLLTRVSHLFPEFPGNLGNIFSDDRQWGNGWTLKVPAANITENDKEFNLELAVPGMKKEDFKIGIENQQLNISCEQKENKETNDEQYTLREFSYESFNRSFMLPESVNAEGIKANYAEGVLKIVLPKKELAKIAPKKQIKVK